MASRYPAEFLGLGGELGRIAPGYRASLVLVDDEVDVRETLDRRPAYFLSREASRASVPDPLHRVRRQLSEHAAPVSADVPKVRFARTENIVIEQAGPGAPELRRHWPDIQQAMDAGNPFPRPSSRPRQARRSTNS